VTIRSIVSPQNKKTIRDARALLLGIAGFEGNASLAVMAESLEEKPKPDTTVPKDLGEGKT
jgi:hypothetical protein